MAQEAQGINVSPATLGTVIRLQLTAESLAALKKEVVGQLPSRLRAGGRIVIISDGTAGFYSSIRKYWTKAESKLRLRFAASLADRAAVRDELQRMRRTQFAQGDVPGADVTVTSIDNATRALPDCKIVYVFTDVADSMLEELGRRMHPQGMLVQCALTRPTTHARLRPRSFWSTLGY